MLKSYDEKNKESNNPEVSLGQELLNLLLTHGSKVAQVNGDTGVQITFHEVWLKTIRIAQNLRKSGFQPRTVLCFMSNNTDHLIPTFLASICLACPVVPLLPTLSKDDIVHILLKTKPAILFWDGTAYDTMHEALLEIKSNMKIYAMDKPFDNLESVESLFAETNDRIFFLPVHINIKKDIAGILYSSGTTGLFKSVCISYGNSVYLEPDIFDKDSVVLSFDSICWSVGIKLIIDCIHSGATRIITSKPYYGEFQLNLIQKYKPNIVCVVPIRFTACLKSDLIDNADLSCVKTIISYGSKVPSSMSAQINQYFPNAKLESWYGMTEMGLISVSYPGARGNGGGERIVSGCLVKIVDDNGNRCGPNVNGEICIKKEHTFLGYLDDPVISAAVFDDEDYFQTDDIGHYDENGTLFIEDRKKNILRVFYFGTVILPSEIEDCLILMPDVKEVCVVGIPISCGTEIPAAVVVRKPKSNLSQNDVFNVVADKFPSHSKLRGGVYFIESLPKTYNGKFVRREITAVAIEKFQLAMESDPDIKLYLSDIPETFRNRISTKHCK